MAWMSNHRSAHSVQRVYHHKQQPAPQTPMLGASMITFFKQSVQRRETKLAKIAEAWATLVPELMIAHCSLESLSRGNLFVIVDSASHLYELKQLLLAGLQQQLLLACKGAGLTKITLRAGRWYDADGKPSTQSSDEKPEDSPRFKPKRMRAAGSPIPKTQRTKK
jgi:hypothetical protein